MTFIANSSVITGLYFMITRPLPIADKLPIKTLVAMQLLTNTHSCTHTYTQTHTHTLISGRLFVFTDLADV